MKQTKAALLFFVLIPCLIYAQSIQFENLPVHLQLFPRNQQDSSSVLISGEVTNVGFDSIVVEVLKNQGAYLRLTTSLAYSDTVASFYFSPKIHAELSEYQFRVFLDTGLVAEVDSVVCGDVFLINGQSNALAMDYDELATYQSEWFRSFGNSSQIAAECQNDLNWGLAQGHTVATHAAVGVWGLRLGQLVVETYNIPVCILNGASGGSYISEHLRNDDNPTHLNTNYGRLLYRIRRAKLQDGVKTIFWNQGEMNTDATWSDYAAQFDQLYHDWKEDFSAISHVYLFQIRPCHGATANTLLREVQRKIPESYPDVDIMSTAGIPGHDGLHYHYEGYTTMAEWLFPLIGRDFYGSTDTTHITPPNIKAAYYRSNPLPELSIVFDQTVVWPQDTLGASMKDNFFLVGDNTTTIDNGYAIADTVKLQLSSPTEATGISYLPNKFYSGTIDIYEGPWLRNPRSIGALTFYAFPIIESAVLQEINPVLINGTATLDTNYPNPFNSGTKIRYKIIQPGLVSISIFNIKGQKVVTLLNSTKEAGEHSIQWSPVDLPSGIYFCRLNFNGTFTAKKRLLFLK